MEFLTIEYNTNFYDNELKDFLVDTVNIAFNGINYLHVGYRKKFNDIYIELSDPVITSTNQWEYFNGTTWEILETVDETSGLTKPGFVFFTPPSDWEMTGVEAKEAYYIRLLKPAAETVILNGVGAVFANDNDLKEKYRKINDFLAPGDLNFIAFHQSVRKDIVQYIRNKGNAKYNNTDIFVWDFLDRSQLRLAGTYWALAQIFFNVSDSTDGKFYQLAQDYVKKAQKNIDVYLLDLDKDDDGEKSNDPLNKINYTRIVDL